VTVRPALLLLAALASFGPIGPSSAASDSPVAAEPYAGAELAFLAVSPVAAEPPPAAESAFLTEPPAGPESPYGASILDPAQGPPAPESHTAPAVEPLRPGTALFYFFSPDWRPPDFSKLTFAVEQALASGDVHVAFQAFTRYEDFERQMRARPPTFMIAPAWLEGSAGASLGASYSVIARPMRHGRSSYRKALMTRSNADSIDDLARGSIAATLHSMGSGDPAAVLGAFHLAAGTARIVPVPKDIDALLALSFGQVDAALVTSEQYEQLARTSPAEAERLRVLAFSSEVGLPPVFASADAETSERERLTALLPRIREVPNGADLLTMLAFDGFESEQVLAARREAEADQAAASQASSAAAASAVATAQSAAEQQKAAASGSKASAKPKPVAKSARPAKKTASGDSTRRD
jgi:ABC-type amino acid transport substrate-binding protein